jgi:CMD domain protein
MPADLPANLPADERSFVAAFLALLQGEEATSEHYIFLLQSAGSPLADLAPMLWVEAAGASVPGPYGRYPSGPLSIEDLDGPAYRVSDHLRAQIGTRLIAALEHAHLVALHPRDASPAALTRLREGGFSNETIVLLSQLIGFVLFQVRVVTGLRSIALSRTVERQLAAE